MVNIFIQTHGELHYVIRNIDIKSNIVYFGEFNSIQYEVLTSRIQFKLNDAISTVKVRTVI
jgi:hypothetical protein